MNVRKSHRPFCYICNNVIRVDYWVPNQIWELSLHRSHRKSYICLECFTRNSDERGVEWSNDITLYPQSQIKDISIKQSAK